MPNEHPKSESCGNQRSKDVGTAGFSSGRAHYLVRSDSSIICVARRRRLLNVVASGWTLAGKLSLRSLCSLTGRSSQDDGKGKELKSNKLKSTFLVLHFFVVRYGNYYFDAREPVWRTFPELSAPTQP